MTDSIDYAALADAARDGYMNRVIASVNDHAVHLSVMDAPYRWHLHPDSDETFIGVEGTLVIEFEEGAVDLHAGELLTVPAGKIHCTRPGGARSVNLTVEKKDAETVFCEAPG
ncbi:cupin domain-containing protein [Caballeronia sp. LZ034LL]|uniref:cupin domain-containing protein n=1 Tax=Caballeronia sp. LZ034LL TaxID=3038567 RepID=UPI0028627B0D|nr:cupin domain-containing protein [Caballeronia sp. LZ034LL]MDR5837699.1 cupin domain-containing protein [Caballeronia sp. LZ034LL]